MGTPNNDYQDREPVRISLAEIVQAFAHAQSIARSRTEEGREAALERLRAWLAPMVPWLHKPIGQLSHIPKERKEPGGKVRVLVLFDLPLRQANGVWLGIDRGGNWVYVEHGVGFWKLRQIDGETLERTIWTCRKKFLHPQVVHAASMHEITEKASMFEHLMRHACFLGFIEVVVLNIDQLLKTRENRLQTMRENLNAIGSFGSALDPVVYRKRLTLLGYSAFFVRPGHTSRDSADYFVKQPVEQVVTQSNVVNKDRYVAGEGYVVNTSEFHVTSSRGFLEHVSDVLEEAEKRTTSGHSRRGKFTDEEISVLEAFVTEACSFDTSV
jgi:hypothetical protein